MENKIKVIELFAGVGGFRLGLEGWKNKFIIRRNWGAMETVSTGESSILKCLFQW